MQTYELSVDIWGEQNAGPSAKCRTVRRMPADWTEWQPCLASRESQHRWWRGPNKAKRNDMI